GARRRAVQVPAGSSRAAATPRAAAIAAPVGHGAAPATALAAAAGEGCGPPCTCPLVLSAARTFYTTWSGRAGNDRGSREGVRGPGQPVVARFARWPASAGRVR